jgi:hypothetical protein
VTLDELLFPSARPGPRKVSGRLQANSSQRRPTSDLLNEELLNRLLGRQKRSSRAKEESAQKQVVKAKVTYDHNLFPPSHEIDHEETFTVTRAPICKPQQTSAQKTKLRKGQDHPQVPRLERLATEETERAAEASFESSVKDCALKATLEMRPRTLRTIPPILTKPSGSWMTFNSSSMPKSRC